MAVLVSVALTVRALQAGALREAVLAGTFAGVALALKPANALFLGGPLLAFLLARRFVHAALFAVALGPALLALTIWKSKGLGEVPLFALDEVRLAAGAGDPAVASVTSWFDRTVHLNFDTWKQNMSNLREFTWSARVIQFLPLAGAVAVARRSVPAAGLFLGWLLGYVIVKGAADVATVESGSFWRLIMPGLPAFVLLAAAIPAPRPDVPRADGPAPHAASGPATRPARDRRGRRVPRARPARRPPRLDSRAVRHNPTPPPDFVASEVIVDEIGVPADPDVVSLEVRRVGGANELTWTDSTERTRTFYRVYRSSLSRGSPT